MNNFARAAGLAGIGQSVVGQYPQFDTSALLRSATLGALDDAGLAIADVEGLLTVPSRVIGMAHALRKRCARIGYAALLSRNDRPRRRFGRGQGAPGRDVGGYRAMPYCVTRGGAKPAVASQSRSRDCRLGGCRLGASQSQFVALEERSHVMGRLEGTPHGTPRAVLAVQSASARCPDAGYLAFATCEIA